MIHHLLTFVLDTNTNIAYKFNFFSRTAGNRVSTSSDFEKRRSLSRSTAGGDNNCNDTASDEDSQLSYSTTGSPTPNANLQAEPSSISSQAKSASSGKVLINLELYGFLIIYNNIDNT